MTVLAITGAICGGLAIVVGAIVSANSAERAAIERASIAARDAGAAQADAAVARGERDAAMARSVALQRVIDFLHVEINRAEADDAAHLSDAALLDSVRAHLGGAASGASAAGPAELPPGMGAAKPA